MNNPMTSEEQVALLNELRNKRCAHVLYECGEMGIVALTFEVIDSGEGPYRLEFHSVSYTAALEHKLKHSLYWPYWMRKSYIHGGVPEQHHPPEIRSWPGAFKMDDGQIDRIESYWICFFGLDLMGFLGCTVRYEAQTRLYPEREGFYPYIPKHLRGV